MNRLPRRAALALPALLAAPGARASDWPTRPIRLLVGFAAGGAHDGAARFVAPELSRILGQSVVVENRAGASGNLMSQQLVAAPADGYTLGLAGLQITTNPWMIANPGYSPDDLVVVGQIAALPVVVIASIKSGIRDFPGLIAAARAKDGGLTAASGGYGTTSHLGPELVFRNQGVRYTIVVYRGGGPALQGLISGETDVTFDIASPGHRPNFEAGTLRPLAVLQATREPALPDIPAVAEFGLGPEVFVRSWLGLMVRAGTPPEIIARLHQALNQALAVPEVKERMERLGMVVTPSPTQADAQALYRTELARWGALIRAANIRIEG
jgi:tripartite-type tricarboxylate transporter receptor subunit TctC